MENKKKDKMPAKLADDVIDVQFGRKDLADLVNLLSISAQTFEMLANECLKDNNEKGHDILLNRGKLSKTYAHKLALLHNMGETESRELH